MLIVKYLIYIERMFVLVVVVVFRQLPTANCQLPAFYLKTSFRVYASHFFLNASISLSVFRPRVFLSVS